MPFTELSDEDRADLHKFSFFHTPGHPPEGLCIVRLKDGKPVQYWHENGYLNSLDSSFAEYPQLFKRFSAAEKRLAKLRTEGGEYDYRWWLHEDADIMTQYGSRYAEIRNQFPGSPRH